MIQVDTSGRRHEKEGSERARINIVEEVNQIKSQTYYNTIALF